MSLDSDLRFKLSDLLGPAVPVQYNFASREKVQPRVRLIRQNAETDVWAQGDAEGLTETVYAVEVMGLDIAAVALLAAKIKALTPAGMNGFRGTMVGSRVLGCFVADASDDYEPRGLELDDGYHTQAMTLRVITG